MARGLGGPPRAGAPRRARRRGGIQERSSAALLQLPSSILFNIPTGEYGRALATAHIGFDGKWIHERSGDNHYGQRTEDYRPAIGQPPSVKTVTTYDTLGRAVAITEPNGATTTVAHSMFEAITTDPEGHQGKVVKDADDRVVLSAELHEGQCHLAG